MSAGRRIRARRRRVIATRHRELAGHPGLDTTDLDMLERAITLARLAAAAGEVPVGAVVYRGGEVIAEAANDREATADPTGHAELVAIREAGKRLRGWRLAECSLAVTLEPCPMCAGAIVNARVGRVIYGATDPKAGACETLYRITSDPRLNHRPEIHGGVLKHRCGALLSEFFRRRRAERKATLPYPEAMVPRLVVFDLGGVVVRICRSFEEATLAAGVPLRDRTAFERTRDALGRVLAANELGRVPPGDAHRRMSDAIEGLYAAHEIAAIHAAVLREEYPGMAAIVAAIGDSGIETACLSNTDPLHWQVLETLPALRAMHHRHASHLWGLAKPDEAIFRRLEAERGVRGREILFFDDTPANVETARRIGWDAVLVEHAGEPAAQVMVALRARGVAARVG